MVPVAMTAVVKTDCNRIEVLIGEVSAGFVGSIDAHSASVACWMRCDDKGSSRKPELSGGGQTDMLKVFQVFRLWSKYR